MYLSCRRSCSRGFAAYSDLTHPKAPAKAGALVGTRKVIRFWIPVGVNVYIIAYFFKHE